MFKPSYVVWMTFHQSSVCLNTINAHATGHSSQYSQQQSHTKHFWITDRQTRKHDRNPRIPNDNGTSGRLPVSLRPYHYNLSIRPHIYDKEAGLTFDGQVWRDYWHNLCIFKSTELQTMILCVLYFCHLFSLVIMQIKFWK